MSMPFTRQEFFNVFARENHQLWPLQFLAAAWCVVVSLLVIRRQGLRSDVVFASLALFWLANGVLYHWVFFSPINPAAWLFGALFILEGLGLGIVALRSSATLRARWSAWSLFGSLLVAYALIGYPVVGYSLGTRYPFTPIVGVAPCPTTILTLGWILLARRNRPQVAFRDTHRLEHHRIERDCSRCSAGYWIVSRGRARTFIRAVSQLGIFCRHASTAWHWRIGAWCRFLKPCPRFP